METYVDPLEPLPSETGIFTTLREIRDRAADAAASAGGACHDFPKAERISTAAALDAALEASRLGDEELRALSSVLDAQARAAHGRHERSESRGKARRKAWAAFARVIQQPQRGSNLSATLKASFGSGGSMRSIGDLRRWIGLRLPVPCRKLLLGHDAAVTCLSYLPLSMLLVSGAADGKVRLWDPCARRHRLSPPPIPSPRCYSAEEGNIPRQTRRQTDQRESSNRHLRRWPGIYEDASEEWTSTGEAFGCVEEFFLGRKLHSGDGGKSEHRRRSVKAIDTVVIPGGPVGSLIVCDKDSTREAGDMDRERPWEPAVQGTGLNPHHGN